MSTLCEDTDGWTKQYRFTLDIYSMNVLLFLYGIITDCTTNALFNGNNFIYGTNGTAKRYLK